MTDFVPRVRKIPGDGDLHLSWQELQLVRHYQDIMHNLSGIESLIRGCSGNTEILKRNTKLFNEMRLEIRKLHEGKYFEKEDDNDSA